MSDETAKWMANNPQLISWAMIIGIIAGVLGIISFMRSVYFGISSIVKITTNKPKSMNHKKVIWRIVRVFGEFALNISLLCWVFLKLISILSSEQPITTWLIALIVLIIDYFLAYSLFVFGRAVWLVSLWHHSRSENQISRSGKIRAEFKSD